MEWRPTNRNVRGNPITEASPIPFVGRRSMGSGSKGWGGSNAPWTSRNLLSANISQAMMKCFHPARFRALSLQTGPLLTAFLPVLPHEGNSKRYISTFRVDHARMKVESGNFESRADPDAVMPEASRSFQLYHPGNLGYKWVALPSSKAPCSPLRYLLWLVRNNSCASVGTT